MLLIETTVKVINLTEIKRGSLICGKNHTWETGQPGIVTEATEEKIVVTFLPETQNIQNHYVIYAADIAAGAWDIRYSSDGMETVQTYKGGSENGS